MSRFCFVLRMDATPFYRLRHLPSFYSGIFPTAVINYFALYSEAGSLPRLKLRTAYAFLLTIRQANFPLKRTLPCTAQPFMLRLQEELTVGCLGFLSSSQNRALCALHKPARSVRYPGSLRSIRTSAPLVDETKLSLTREGPLQRKIRLPDCEEKCVSRAEL